MHRKLQPHTKSEEPVVLGRIHLSNSCWLSQTGRVRVWWDFTENLQGWWTPLSDLILFCHCLSTRQENCYWARDLESTVHIRETVLPILLTHPYQSCLTAVGYIHPENAWLPAKRTALLSTIFLLANIKDLVSNSFCHEELGPLMWVQSHCYGTYASQMDLLRLCEGIWGWIKKEESWVSVRSMERAVESWEIGDHQSDHLISLTESHKEWRACGLSSSCYRVKLEGQRTWGTTETQQKINLMVCLKKSYSETLQLKHFCREG